MQSSVQAIKALMPDELHGERPRQAAGGHPDEQADSQAAGRKPDGGPGVGNQPAEEEEQHAHAALAHRTLHPYVQGQARSFWGLKAVVWRETPLWTGSFSVAKYSCLQYHIGLKYQCSV